MVFPLFKRMLSMSGSATITIPAGGAFFYFPKSLNFNKPSINNINLVNKRTGTKKIYLVPVLFISVSFIIYQDYLTQPLAPITRFISKSAQLLEPAQPIQEHLHQKDILPCPSSIQSPLNQFFQGSFAPVPIGKSLSELIVLKAGE